MTYLQLQAHADYHDAHLVRLQPNDLLQVDDYFRWTAEGPGAAFTTIDAGSALVGEPCSYCEVYRLVASTTKTKGTL